MKSIAQTVLTALLLFAGTNLALAQEHTRMAGKDGVRPDPVQMADKRTEDMTKAAGLNTDQHNRVQEINRKYAQNRPAKPTSGTAPTEAERKARHDQHDAARKQQEAELKTVLTTDQWAAWEKYKQDRKGEKGKSGKKGKKGQAAPTKE